MKDPVAQADRLIGFSTRLRQLLAQHGHAALPAALSRDFGSSGADRVATAQTFSNWLNGVQMPRASSLQQLADWLRVTPDFLANGVPVLHCTQARPHDLDAQQLLDHFHRLDTRGRHTALQLVACLARLGAAA